MLKKTALIALLLGALAAPLVWAQDEFDSEADAAGEAGFADEAAADESFDGDATADDADASGEMGDAEDSGDAAFADAGSDESDEGSDAWAGDGADGSEEEESEDASADAGETGDLAGESVEDAQSAGGQAEPDTADSVASAPIPSPTTSNPPPAVAPPVPPPAPPQPTPASTDCAGAGTIQTGTVKRFDETKGFGYITPDLGGADLFVHNSEIRGSGTRETLKENQKVEFEISCGKKGPQARNIRTGIGVDTTR